MPRCEFLGAERSGEAWQVRLGDGSGANFIVRARAIANAGGPWAMEIARRCGAAHGAAALRLVKGSHIVVPRLYMGEQAFLLQNDDRRVVFVLPFAQEFSLIGTTELPFEGDPAGVRCTDDEASYLCRAVNRWFAKPIAPQAIRWRFAGVRPLYEDHAANASAVTRDYVLLLDAGQGAAPLLSVLGGKITTYRRLAEHALERLAPHLPQPRGAWTSKEPLLGGDLPGGDPDAAAESLRKQYPWLEAGAAQRFVARYGSEAAAVLGGAQIAADLGAEFGPGLSAREVDWFCREEWAESADDILWRRTKAGLGADDAARARLEAYLTSQAAVARPRR